jgi:Ca2+-binding EF-hand superfamily protein
VFVDEVLAPLDLDKDGVVSLDEFKKGFWWNISFFR